MIVNKLLLCYPFLVISQVLLLVVFDLFIRSETSNTASFSASIAAFSVSDRRKVARHQKINRESTTTMASSLTSNQNGSAATENTGSTNQRGIAHLLARSNILELQPYRCARDDYSTGILLDANENSYGPPTSVKEQIQQQSSTTLELERYPDPYQIPLKERLIQFRGYNQNTNQSPEKNITADHIFVGVGSDEAIDLLMRIFCIPQQDAIMTTPPTYGMYKVCAKVNDVSIVTVPLTPQFDVEIEKV